MKGKTKVYVRTFKYEDGTEETVKTEKGQEMMRKYRGKYGRKLNKSKIIETKDTVEWT